MAFAGIIMMLSKTDPKSILNISLAGNEKPITITLATTAYQMDEILKALAEIRSKTTLQRVRDKGEIGKP